MSLPDPNRRRGFTLIEVLLVLVILVVLASLTVTAYGRIQRRAMMNAAKAKIGALKTSLGAYQTDIGSYPTTEQGLAALAQAPADLPDPARWTGYVEGQEALLDPWGRQFQYACPGNHNPDLYDLWTVAPDGQEVGNWIGQ